jgi:hypothetical protein
MNIFEEDEQTLPTDVQGFERLLLLLRGLVAGTDESHSLERLRLLLLLARWSDAPPTIREMSRHLHLPLERLSSHVQRLRTTHWLTNEERSYQLSVHGRLLIFVLQMIAQPWQDGDSVAVITQLYAAASSQELGLGPELFFEEVVTAIEESLRRLRRAVNAERTPLVGQFHEESSRNLRMADMALTLRQQGVAEHDFAAVSRMHQALSALTALSGQLEQLHLSLLERDLLTSGQVTLGDIQTWASQTADFACASMIAPYVQSSIPQPWFLSEGKLVAAEQDIAGRQGTISYQKTPPAQRFRTLPVQGVPDPHHERLYALQGQLRQLLYGSEEDLPLSIWVNRPEWCEALLSLIATLDPLLRRGHEPVYLQLNSAGHLVTLEEGAAQQVSEGVLSLQEVPHAF